MITWKTLKKYLPVIGILLFMYILVKLNISSVILSVANANIHYLLISVFLVIILFFPQTFKWWIIARKQNINIGFWESFKINIITNYYGFITPSKIGTVSRAGYLKEKAGGLGKGFSNFVMDKVLDLSSLFFLAIIFSFIFRERFDFLNIGYLVILFVLFVFVCFSLLNKNISKCFLKIIYRKLLPRKMKKGAKLVFENFYKDMPCYSFLFLAFLVNIATWILIYLISYFIGMSLGINLSFIYFLAILPLSTIIAQIPITISGLGTREATMIGLFGLFGIDAVKVFAMSLVAILITNIIPAIIAIFWTFNEK